MFRLANNPVTRMKPIQGWWRSTLLTLLMPVSALAATDSSAVLKFSAPLVERKEQAHFERQYRDFHQAIMQQAGLRTELHFLPIYQVQAKLARREMDGQIGGICGVKRNSPTIDSLPYASLSRHLITAGDSPVFSSVEQLRGKSLALVQRYFYQLPGDDALRDMDIRVHRVEAQANAVTMLMSGRIDVVLAPPQTVESIANKLDPEARFNYTEAPFSVQTLCYILPRTERGTQLVQRINQAIIDLHLSNSLEQYVVAPFQAPSGEALGLVESN